MFRRLTALLLIFLVLTVNYSQLFVYAGFKLNRSYIAANLCENRNQPQMHCNGKCYLMKKLKQAEEKQNNAAKEVRKNLAQETWCTTISAVKFYTQLLRVIPVPTNRSLLSKGYHAILRPPQLG